MAIKTTMTVIRGVEVTHHPDDPERLVNEMAQFLLDLIEYHKKHPKHPGEEGYEFWRHFEDFEVPDG